MIGVVLYLLSLFPAQTVFAHGIEAHPDTIHLEFQYGASHAHITWLAGPRLGEESRLKLAWKDGMSHGPIAAPGDFKIEIKMPDMDHYSPPPLIVPVEGGDPGVFEVHGLYFSMGGTWDVIVTLTTATGWTDTQKFSVELGEGAHSH